MAGVRAPSVPKGLATRGRKLWRDLVADHELGPAELVLLEEACRITDRLDGLDRALAGGDFTRVVIDDDGDLVLKVDGALSEARQQANVLKQLVAALRIPDEATGKRPAQRPARGAYKPTPRGVSSLDRARAARSS